MVDPDPDMTRTLKGDLMALLDSLGVGRVDWRPSGEPFLHPGRGADVIAAERRLGWAGELHPEVAAACDLAGRYQVFALSLDVLDEVVRDHVPFRPIPRFPAMERDLALLVADDLPVAVLLDTACAQAVDLLETIGVFDLYRGEHVPEGGVGVGLRLASAPRSAPSPTPRRTRSSPTSSPTGKPPTTSPCAAREPRNAKT